MPTQPKTSVSAVKPRKKTSKSPVRQTRKSSSRPSQRKSNNPAVNPLPESVIGVTSFSFDEPTSATPKKVISSRHQDPSRKLIKKQHPPQKENSNLLFSGVILLVLFLLASLGLYVLIQKMPIIDPDDATYLKLPRSIRDVKNLTTLIDKYQTTHGTYVFLLFSSIYTFLQAFAIPGAVFLSILAGPLYGVPLGMLIISSVVTVGTSICFVLSKTIARPLITYAFPTHIARFRAQIDENRDNLLFFMLFLRIAPILPNWLITLASPILDVPWYIFAIATFIGILPNNYIMTTIGTNISSIRDNESLVTPQTFLSLLIIACIALIPLLLKKYLITPSSITTTTTTIKPNKQE